MATDNEAAAAGFSVPKGSSLISGGDDAIRQNARTALDLFKTARFVQSVAGVGGDLNNLTTPGSHGYWSDWTNRPSESSGNVLVFPPPNGSGSAVQQLAFPYGNESEPFYRYAGASGTWSQWSPVNSGKFVQSSAGISGDLNDLTAPGAHGYWSTWENRPSETSGSVIVFPPPAGSGLSITQVAFPYGSNSGIFQRFAGASGTFSGWTRLDAGAIDPTATSNSAGLSASALKRVPLALTAATASGTTTDTAGSVRFPINYGARITRWRVHVRNHNYAAGTTYTTGATVAGVWFGTGTGPAFSAAPAQVAGALTVPDDGTDAVTPWITTPIEAGVDNLLSIGWTAPSGTKVRTAGGGWVASSSSAASAQSGTGFTDTYWMPLDWWIEAETAATTPTVAGWGDSITTGTGTDKIIHTSWLSQFARKIGALPVHWSYPGSGMSLWMSTNDQKWDRWQDFPHADAVIHFMGQNDLGSAASAAVMRERFDNTLPMVKARISPNVYAATITPHATKTDEQNAIRLEHNTYLRSLPGGVRDVFEFAAAVSSDDRALNPEYRGGTGTDELHPNAAGGLAMANTVTRPIVTVPVEEEQTTGWRNITHPSLTAGKFQIKRTGNLVYMNWDAAAFGTNTGHTYLAAIVPAGFRTNVWIPFATVPLYGPALGCRLMDGAAQGGPGTVHIAGLTSGAILRAYAVWETEEPFPTTLPGTPA